jgi:hypothetical protein
MAKFFRRANFCKFIPRFATVDANVTQPMAIMVPVVLFGFESLPPACLFRVASLLSGHTLEDGVLGFGGGVVVLPKSEACATSASKQ